MLNKRKIELLSPAKNYECGVAAINAGADAVYIGGPKFGARKDASNSLREVISLIEYAHQFRVRVYVAINTILFDNEIEEVRELIEKLYNHGADGIIIQDMAILEMDLPPIKIIASTQCDNYDIEKIKFLEKVGIRRVILARELSLEQMKAIRKSTNIELETFVHGALCVGMSGKCYLSELVAKKSANRGRCQQLCRFPYSLVDAEGKVLIRNKFLLSLKDLNLSKDLEDILGAGIDSLKIEGRLKDDDYVSNVTYFYRRKLDRILKRSNDLERSSVGNTYVNWEPELEKSFNRDFTDYFLRGRQKDILSINSPKSKGKLLGRVKTVSTNYFILEKNVEVENNDGLCFFDVHGNLQGSNVIKVFGPKIYLNDMSKLEPGVDIYRNSDVGFSKAIKSNPPKRLVPVFFELHELDNGLRIIVRDEEGNEAMIEKEIEKVEAENKEGAMENIKGQLAKLGDTIYEAKDISIFFEKPLFLKISAINALRREVIVIFDKVRKSSYKRDEDKISKSTVPYPEKKLDYQANVSNTLAQKFYERHGVKEIEPAFEILKDKKGKKVMTTKHCLRHYFGKCLKDLDKSMKEPLYLVDSKGYKYRLKFDCKNCQMEVYYKVDE
ncbi:MAG: U32 family peptidase [Candidatus Pacebacteria bacterium]|nr:U32 family peptidase [Candidatus Paceibacterota bacterium]